MDFNPFKQYIDFNYSHREVVTKRPILGRRNVFVKEPAPTLNCGSSSIWNSCSPRSDEKSDITALHLTEFFNYSSKYPSASPDFCFANNASNGKRKPISQEQCLEFAEESFVSGIIGHMGDGRIYRSLKHSSDLGGDSSENASIVSSLDGHLESFNGQKSTCSRKHCEELTEDPFIDVCTEKESDQQIIVGKQKFNFGFIEQLLGNDAQRDLDGHDMVHPKYSTGLKYDNSHSVDQISCLLSLAKLGNAGVYAGKNYSSLDTGKFCVFCKKNKERREYYTTHVLKDTWGRVICPILRQYMCPICGATGDHAHTLQHCPYKAMS